MKNPKLHTGGLKSDADYHLNLWEDLRREPTFWEIYRKTHKYDLSNDGSTAIGWINDAAKQIETKYKAQIDELKSKGMYITYEVEEEVFRALSTSMVKRLDRRPNYGNIPAM